MSGTIITREVGREESTPLDGAKGWKRILLWVGAFLYLGGADFSEQVLHDLWSVSSPVFAGLRLIQYGLVFGGFCFVLYCWIALLRIKWEIKRDERIRNQDV